MYPRRSARDRTREQPISEQGWESIISPLANTSRPPVRRRNLVAELDWQTCTQQAGFDVFGTTHARMFPAPGQRGTHACRADRTLGRKTVLTVDLRVPYLRRAVLFLR